MRAGREDLPRGRVPAILGAPVVLYLVVLYYVFVMVAGSWARPRSPVFAPIEATTLFAASRRSGAAGDAPASTMCRDSAR